MLDPSSSAAETVARGEAKIRVAADARERAERRRASVAIVRPQLARYAADQQAESGAVRVLLDQYAIESATATVWREMYFALEARLLEAGLRAAS